MSEHRRGCAKAELPWPESQDAQCTCPAGKPSASAAQGEERGDGRRIKLTKASDIRIRPVRFIWQDRIPVGTITLIPGREGIGKSLTLTWLTAKLTRGELPGIFEGDPRPVFYAATEDSWEHTIAPRLVAARADLDLVYRIEVESVMTGSTMPLTLPRDTDALAAEVKRLGVAMLALDPLMSVVAANIDTHRDREVRTALEPLAKLADEANCAVTGLAHFNKSASSDASNLITGSRAFSAVARAVISIARDPESEEGECVLSQTKNNLGRLDLPNLTYVVDSVVVETEEGDAHVGRLRFTGESDRGVNDILASVGPPDSDDREDRSEAAKWLESYLSDNDGEAEVIDILKAGDKIGFGKDVLKRAKKKISAVSRKEGMDAGWMWALPKGAKGAKGAKSVDSEDGRPLPPPSGEDHDAKGAEESTVPKNPPPSLPSLPSLPSQGDPPGMATCMQCGHRVSSLEHEFTCVNGDKSDEEIAAFMGFDVAEVAKVRAEVAAPDGASPRSPFCCHVCGYTLDPSLIAAGHQTHRGCEGDIAA